MSVLPDFEAYVKRLDNDAKICLWGKYWDDLFTIATGSKGRDNSVLPNPLILAGWHMSDDDQKAERFRLHLKYGHENGRWKELHDYISLAPEDAWYINTKYYKSKEDA